MLATIPRAGLRTAQSSLRIARTGAGRRFISTEPPHLRSRSWKSTAARWGIAIAGIYYYNTSPVFAEQPQHNLLNPNLDALDDSDNTSSLDTLTSRRARQSKNNAQKIHSAADAVSSENASTSVAAPTIDAVGGAAGELEEEAESEGAFNPETGEINWDCPCLGGMAHGPCGPQFREAFSCFVFSTEEPKGMDCIEKFQGMRDCFQEHPDVYKDELMEDEEIDREVEAEQQALAQQIAERQKADQQSGRRLLEEPAPEPRPKNSNKPAKQPSPKAAAVSTLPTTDGAEARVPTPYPALATDPSVTGQDVVPEAAHNATQAPTSEGKENQ